MPHFGVATPFGVMVSHVWRGPGVAPPIGVLDSQKSMWALQLGSGTSNLRFVLLGTNDGLPGFGVAPVVGSLSPQLLCCPLTLIDRLPHFVVAFRFLLMDAPTSVAFSNWGDEPPNFGVARRVGVVDSHTSILPLKFARWIPTLSSGLFELGLDSHTSVWPLKLR